MARAGARAYKGVWGLRPHSGMKEQSPWGSQWAEPPDAEDILAFRLPVLLKFIAPCLWFMTEVTAL